jgi:chemotaxis signal transduction protein
VESIQRNPELSNEQVNDFVEGLISIDEKMVIILDINKLASEWSLDLDQQESAA